MEYGDKISALRKSKGMTQAELGASLNVTFQAVSKWERGESVPDFETMSRIARLFGVPISYFEEADGEVAAVEDGGAEKDSDREDGVKEPAAIGFCKSCGKIVKEGEAAQTTPHILCNACAARQEREKREKEKQENAQKAAAAAAKLAVGKRRRNRGLIWSAVICTILIIIFAVCAASDPQDYLIFVMLIVGTVVFGYTCFAQLFWCGIVFDVFFAGGKVIGMPGVIFTLDLDGVIFLIAVKILFAIIRMAVFLLTLCATGILAAIISPFTFVPQMKKISLGEEL